MSRRRATNKGRVSGHQKVVRVISHLMHCLEDDDVEVLYADEMKFPLYQTPSYSWAKSGEDHFQYNNRPDNMSLTAIALCSAYRFEAVQIYVDEVKAVDFLYFMQTAIQALPSDKRYTVLVDNAAWHNARLVQQSDVWRFLYFNEPGQYRINLIENAFSAVRALFRQRLFAEGLAEEVRNILAIFFDSGNSERFEGCRFNHIRAIVSYFKEDT